MPSRKQWVLIGAVALLVGVANAASPAAAVGGTFGVALIMYGLVAGYNGRDLWAEFKGKIAG